ncbi:abl interactor 2-like isoform X3 [Haliotis rubra]|uniref:abl interactor 2-like isoform X3 n=1 Tax=Haliotis rubra TaxID=36100 RepID=UPI001EE56203|nr:abl interactor 2-like isoform X3 [Haliotis rubra]
MAASEVSQLIDIDIPTGRQNLQENHANLQHLAEHCEERYKQADDKRQALEETKDYTTHSLASVAYQIHTLAANFLNLLDMQQNQLSGMESSINHLSQIVNIHKEKVARREIGVITTNRTSLRAVGTKNGIIFPEQAERPVKYQRKPVDYTVLDSTGHGIKAPSSAPKNSRPPSIASQGSSHAPTTRPPTPPISRSGSMSGGSISGASTSGTIYGTLGRSHYRSVAPPVAPPSVPANQQYATGQSQHGARDRYEMLYAPSVMGTVHSPPPLGMARPTSDRVSYHRESTGDVPLPPPPPTLDHEGQDALASTVVSPPPPPPPEAAQGYGYGNDPPPPPPEFSDTDSQPPPPPEDPYMETGPQLTTQPDWIPKHYQEKVIAIYDYKAEKEDELTFSENSLIFVLKKNEDDWWEGVMDGQRGLFPSNYVEPCM